LTPRHCQCGRWRCILVTDLVRAALKMFLNSATRKSRPALVFFFFDSERPRTRVSITLDPTPDSKMSGGWSVSTGSNSGIWSGMRRLRRSDRSYTASLPNSSTEVGRNDDDILQRSESGDLKKVACRCCDQLLARANTPRWALLFEGFCVVISGGCCLARGRQEVAVRDNLVTVAS
jgi:hypothetical protein